LLPENDEREYSMDQLLVLVLQDQSNRIENMPTDRKCRQREEYSFEINQSEKKQIMSILRMRYQNVFVISRKQ
jgi:hypothetical protein